MTRRSLAPTVDLEVQAEIRARGGRLLNSLLLDEQKVFNSGVLLTFLMEGWWSGTPFSVSTLSSALDLTWT